MNKMLKTLYKQAPIHIAEITPIKITMRQMKKKEKT